MNDSPASRGDTTEDVLLAASRVQLDPRQHNRFLAAVQAGPDWDRVLRLAAAHGIGPLLFKHLGAGGADTVPPTVRESLRDITHATVRHSLLLTRELLRLLRSFSRHGIHAIPYKGPTLAVLAYGGLGLRPFNDLDLLIRPCDFARASALLQEDGYQVHIHLTLAQLESHRQAEGQVPFLSGDGACLVELHTDLVPRSFSFPLPVTTLCQRLRTVRLGGQEVQTLAPEELLLVLCVHGAKHQWIYLGWICDIAELLRIFPALDWGHVYTLAARARGERLLHLGLLLAQDCLGATLPLEIAQRAASDRLARELLVQVRRQLFVERTGWPGGLESCLFQVRARECWRDSLRLCLTLLLAPTPGKDVVLRLPPSLHFLYAFVRPPELVWRYARDLWARLRADAPRRVEGALPGPPHPDLR